MDRRNFFKSLGLTAAALTVPEIILPSKSIFLPPRGGWIEPDLRMREIRQYCINTDTMPWRYDAAWERPDGVWAYYYIDFPDPTPGTRDEIPVERLIAQRIVARAELTRIEAAQGFRRRHAQTLALPNGYVMARYVG